MLKLILPHSIIERRFALGFSVMLLICVGLLIWMGGPGWAAFFDVWLPVLGGDSEMKTKTVDFARGGTVFAASGSILLILILWLTRRWWCITFNGGETVAKGGRVFLTGLIVVGVIATALRAPRMMVSLYNDETETVQRYIAGQYEHDYREADEVLLSDELPKFRSVDWTTTFHDNRRGNNHNLFSILGRLIHSPFVDTPGELNEYILRIPALLGGLLSIAAVGGILSSLGRPRVGLIAMILLALHPWHVRFSSEARGYGLQMGFAALTVWCLVRAWKTGGWGWWLGFAAAQAFTLWANVGALYFAIGLNVAAAIGLVVHWRRNREYGATGVRFRQWFVSNLLSAIAFMLVMAPSVPQISRATEINDSLRTGLPWGWEIDVPALLFVGMPYNDADPNSVINPAIQKWFFTEPLMVIGIIGVLILLGAGVVSLLRQRGPEKWLLVITPILGVGLSLLVSGQKGVTFLEWYVVWATPFVAIWLASGVSSLCLNSEGRAPAWRRFAIYGCIVLFVFASWKPLQVYRYYGKQAMREAVEIANHGRHFPDLEAAPTKPIVAHWYTYAPIYDPYTKVAFKTEHLEGLVQKARAENRELYFILAQREAASAENGEIIARLDSAEFEFVSLLPGLEEPQFNTEVFRWVGP